MDDPLQRGRDEHGAGLLQQLLVAHALSGIVALEAAMDSRVADRLLDIDTGGIVDAAADIADTDDAAAVFKKSKGGVGADVAKALDNDLRLAGPDPVGFKIALHKVSHPATGRFKPAL